MDAATGCPKDYAELYEAYFPMMRGVVARSGISPEDVEDVAMDILARFIEKDGISYYDPHRLHDVGESPDLPGARFRKAKFKGMLRGFTATYVMQYRDKQMVRHRREPWRLETPVRNVGTQREVSWVEMTFSETPNPQDSILDTEVSITLVRALKQARRQLEEHSTTFRDYPRFIDLCCNSGFMDGEVDRRAVASELGIGVSTVSSMLKVLRSTLDPLLAEVA